MWLAGLKASTNFCGVYEFKYPQVDWTCSSSNLSILRLLYQLPVLTLHIPTPAGTPTPFLIMLYQFPILNLSIPTPASTPTPFLITLDQFTILTLRIPTPVHPQPIPHYALPVSYINPLHPPPPPPPPVPPPSSLCFTSLLYIPFARSPHFSSPGLSNQRAYCLHPSVSERVTEDMREWEWPFLVSCQVQEDVEDWLLLWLLLWLGWTRTGRSRSCC